MVSLNGLIFVEKNCKQWIIFFFFFHLSAFYEHFLFITSPLFLNSLKGFACCVFFFFFERICLKSLFILCLLLILGWILFGYSIKSYSMCTFVMQYRPSSTYSSQFFTTNSGAPVWNNNSSLTVGSRGIFFCYN